MLDSASINLPSLGKVIRDCSPALITQEGGGGSYLFEVAKLGEGGERLQTHVDHAEGLECTEVAGQAFDLRHPAVIQVQVFDLQTIRNIPCGRCTTSMAALQTIL